MTPTPMTAPDPPMTAPDSSMAKPARRLIIGCLIGIATLPPALWIASGLLFRLQNSVTSISLGSLATSTAFMALASATLALALWVTIFTQPVSALRRAESRIRSIKMRDPLTGLPNRDGQRLALAHALKNSAGNQGTVGILLLDVDRFRLFNDSLGQPAGDQLLQSVADRIRAVVRANDIVARTSGDQFVVQVNKIASVQGLIVMARNILRAFEPAYPIGGRDTVITLSIGIAVADETLTDVDDLLKSAETAMRAAKHDGGNRFRVYETAMQADDKKRLETDLRLRQALNRDEFKLVYQPIMNGQGDRIITVEALLRWIDPERGTIGPAEFIPVLEQTGMIVEVGTWVLKTACTQCLEWLDEGATGLKLSVNVSPRQFAETDLVATVTAVLAETGFPPSQLQLEVTESLLLDPSPESLEKIDALVDIGVHLALDDFGMGYSSLAYLKRFPLHTLKIDRMFVRDIPHAERDTSIVRAIIDLGHGLGMHVTAEGVETLEQFHGLRDLGCDSLQGFYFSRPVDADEFATILANEPDPNRVDQATQDDEGAATHGTSARRVREFVHLIPVKRRVRIVRNDEVLVDSTRAIRAIQSDSYDWDSTLYMPETDIKVTLRRSEQVVDETMDSDAVYFDLVGHNEQIIQACIAWSHPTPPGDASQLGGRIAFRPEFVTVEESPV